MTQSDTIARVMQRAGVQPACCISILMYGLVVICTSAYPATAMWPRPHSDSSSATVHDTLGLEPSPYPHLGSIIVRPSDAAHVITKRDRRAIQYQSMADLLIRALPYQPLSHGGMAQHSSISVFGGYNTDLTVALNGRPLVDPWSGTFHLMQSAPERFEQIELLTGVNAVGLAPQMTLTAVNQQEIMHRTPTPYTQLWYSQGGGDVLAADVELSQNVAPGVNATLGIRRTGGQGRYQRTDFDAWNASFMMRAALSPEHHLNLSYHLVSLNTDLWGGLRTDQPLSIFAESNAPTVFASLRDETRRHDLTATYAYVPTGDSIARWTAQAYGSLAAIRRQTSTSESAVGRGTHGGILIRTDHRWSWLHLRLGGGIDVTNAPAWSFEWDGARSEVQSLERMQPQIFAHAIVPLAETGWELRTSARAQATLISPNSSVQWAGGLGLTRLVGDGGRVSVEVVRSERMPSPAEGLGLSPEVHRAALATALIRGTGWSISAEGYLRDITSPLQSLALRDSTGIVTAVSVINGTTSIRHYGVVLDGRWNHGWMDLRSVVRLQAGTVQELPAITASLEAAVVYAPGSSLLRAGLRGALQTAVKARAYVPLTWSYASEQEQQRIVGNGVDAFIHARLGHADVRLSYENILQSRWYTVAVMPEIIQDLRLSITWAFLD